MPPTPRPPRRSPPQPRPPSLRRLLQKRLEGAQRIALLAVGSELRGDDAAGLLVADYVEKACGLKTEGRRAAEHSDPTFNHQSKSNSLPTPVLGLKSSASSFHPSVAPLQSSAFSLQPILHIFRGHTAPENCTGALKQFAPTHLLIVDAADLGQPPGHIAVLAPEQIAGVSFSTHQMPLSVLLDYLKTSFAFTATVLAIQPAQMHFDQPVTPAIRRAARRLATALASYA